MKNLSIIPLVVFAFVLFTTASLGVGVMYMTYADSIEIDTTESHSSPVEQGAPVDVSSEAAWVESYTGIKPVY